MRENFTPIFKKEKKKKKKKKKPKFTQYNVFDYTKSQKYTKKNKKIDLFVPWFIGFKLRSLTNKSREQKKAEENETKLHIFSS